MPSDIHMETIARVRNNRSHPGFYFHHMYPPGKLLVLRSSAKEEICCGLTRDADWKAEWAPRSALEEIIVTPKAIEYHFPHIIAEALRVASLTVCGRAA